ncbi:MAG: DegT/DnrJ/EryC1/StrS family aminotransferase [Bryobacterales bacterium]|nr:DegT/DnrJ/EryC1/StrS family aminotransferase [Bryobacteraceae bacterium]MDW8353458.1 DegT/DnrJ/EryC1/StrS family aminotransferase [Bryobacterales bacterium]
MPDRLTRRRFLAAPAAAPVVFAADDRLALHGGRPVRSEPFPSWPKVAPADEEALLEVLRSGQWFRGTAGRWARRFEEAYAKLVGTKHCLATANGTSALFASLHALGVSPGDEVIVPPYTFVATVNVVLLHYALPVFVDTDPETFQIDARKIEAAITEHTRAIVPVHLGGNVADMDTILNVARKHKLAVVEDACQAHLAEWRGRKAGSLGEAGCFSFQVSKNLCAGEGGAIVTDRDDLIERCFTFHNNSRSRRTESMNFSYDAPGANLRMTQFQAALLVAQMARLEEQSRRREQNAEYLAGMLREIPGIQPARQYEGCTRNAFHLFMLRYDKEGFAGAPRDLFLKALRAEGIPCSGGYRPLNKEPFLLRALQSRGYKAIYSPERLARWQERNHCPANDRLCEEAVWFPQTMLLGERRDMEQIAEAIRKIQKRAGELRKS